MNTFNHGYESHELESISGYGRCLSHLLEYIQEQTNFDPKKRMIDSVPLLDKIGATAKEFYRFFEIERTKLEAIKL